VGYQLFCLRRRAFELAFEIHSIDLPADMMHVEHPGMEHGRLVRGLPGVHLHRGDGVTVALAQWEQLGRPAKPLFFVDGDHAYESVLRELDMIFATVPDGSALVHDAFFQSAQSCYNVGPARAVDTIVARHSSRLTSLTSGLNPPA
jgi:hypothetical protein